MQPAAVGLKPVEVEKVEVEEFKLRRALSAASLRRGSRVVQESSGLPQLVSAPPQRAYNRAWPGAGPNRAHEGVPLRSFESRPIYTSPWK